MRRMLLPYLLVCLALAACGRNAKPAPSGPDAASPTPTASTAQPPMPSASATQVRPAAPAAYALLARVVAPDARFRESFGRAIAIDGDILAIGAPGRAQPGPNAGVVFIYEIEDGACRLVQTIPNPRLGGAHWGSQLAFVGHRLLVSRKFATANEPPMWMERRGQAFEPAGVITKPREQGIVSFGSTIVASGQRLAIAARGTYSVPGLVFLFDVGEEGPKLVATLDGAESPSWEEHNFYLGDAIALDDDRIALGATLGADGSMLVLRRDGGAWKHEQTIVRRFDGVALSGEKLIITAGWDQAATEVYRSDNSRWTRVQKLEKAEDAAISGDLAALTGGAILEWKGSQYVEAQRLTGVGERRLTGAGPVMLAPGRVVIGQPEEGGKGAVYVYAAKER